MSILKIVKPDNGNIIARKVIYETYKKTDPKDTGQEFYEIVTENDAEFPEGTLVKYNQRLIQETELEGEMFVVLLKSQIHYHIEKSDVKENLLKRK